MIIHCFRVVSSKVHKTPSPPGPYFEASGPFGGCRHDARQELQAEDEVAEGAQALQEPRVALEAVEEGHGP